MHTIFPSDRLEKLGYWGAMGQKSGIRKMSSDFVESVERVPQRSQFAPTYGFWK